MLSTQSQTYRWQTARQENTTPRQVAFAGLNVLCVDQSADVLAYLRELLRGAGYNVLTNSNLHDSLILSRATRPGLLILGPNLMASPRTQQAFRAACATVPVVELGNEFSTLDAGQAASDLLEKSGHACIRRVGSLPRSQRTDAASGARILHIALELQIPRSDLPLRDHK